MSPCKNTIMENSVCGQSYFSSSFIVRARDFVVHSTINYYTLRGHIVNCITSAGVSLDIFTINHMRDVCLYYFPVHSVTYRKLFIKTHTQVITFCRFVTLVGLIFIPFFKSTRTYLYYTYALHMTQCI